MSYRGGLSNRTGYAVESLGQHEAVDPGYYEEKIIPFNQVLFFK